MVAYVDCEGCGCLIRSEETWCPFCDRRASVLSNAGLRLFGLAAGLTLATVSCGTTAGNDTGTTGATGSTGSTTVGEETISSAEQSADAVTYAGPDDASITDSGSSTSVSVSTTYDPTDADAVTYAGPDESTSTDPFPETTSTTETTGSETGATTSSGTGDTDPNG